MKLEDQVLSIDQVQELKKLEFNVEKYASMCWLAYNSDIPPYNKEYNLCTHDIYCYESSSLEPIPTLSIGDIIEILPARKYENYCIKISKNNIYYSSDDYFSINGQIKGKLIDAFFEILKWCIKNDQVTEVDFLPPI